MSMQRGVSRLKHYFNSFYWSNNKAFKIRNSHCSKNLRKRFTKPLLVKNREIKHKWPAIDIFNTLSGKIR